MTSSTPVVSSLLLSIRVFQQEKPGSLLRVIQLAGAASVFPEDVVDVFEGLFEHALEKEKLIEEGILLRGKE